MIRQISIFLGNSPGRLNNVLSTIARVPTNIITFNISDTGEYGIARFIVEDHEKALEAVNKAGIPAAATEVLAVELKDVPGELFRITDMLAGAGINLEYAYSARLRKGESAVVILKPEQLEEALEVFRREGVVAAELI